MSILVPLLLLNPTVWLFCAAVVPAVVLLVYVYKHDRMEKESPKMLFHLFLVGVGSTFLAGFTEGIGMSVLASAFRKETILCRFLLYFVVVALSEEGFKYLVLKLRSWKDREFSCAYDGLIYAVFVSLGFAVWENISYVFSYGLTTALVRAITAVPGHACFGVFMGIFYGAARKAANVGDMARSKKYRFRAVAVPTLIHGFYDFTASGGGWYQLVFMVFIVLLFIICFRLVKETSNSDHYISYEKAAGE